jgi:predicted AlkP superfamily phosphohydrolase/phosphomutase
VKTARARGEAIRIAMDRGDWDLLVGVFTNTDRMQHHFWRKERELIRELYRIIDDQVGQILAKVDRGRTMVLVLSDHGFTTTDRRFYVNRWLKREGYLGVRRTAEFTDDYQQRRFNWFMNEPEEARRKDKLGTRLLKRFGLKGELAIDWSKTKAYLYSSDTRGIHINLEGRQPQGVVSEADYEPLRDEIVSKLRALTFPETGEPVFDLVAKREDLYDGPYIESSPDILTVPQRDRYRVVTKVDGKRIFRQHRIPDGYHRGEGLAFAAGPGIAKGGTLEGASIADVMPTLLYAAGIPIPERADGKVLKALFTEEMLAARTEERAPEAPDAAAAAVELSAEEDEALRQTLEGLGYL